MRIQNIDYDRLRAHYPSLFISYCLDDPRAAKFFAHRYRDKESLLRRARRAAERGLERSVLESLRRYHLECGAPRESMAALEKLGGGAAAVVTGQQPSVGWGPLYNLYKAQAALQIARSIEAAGVPCVAVFWNHSDDVRGGDAVFFPDRQNEVREVRLPPDEAGRPLCESGSSEALRMFASVLTESLPQTGFSPWLREMIHDLHRGSIAESFTRALLAGLGSQGLVVLEPRHLEGERASKLFADHLAHPERLSGAVEEGRKRVIAEGFEDHLGRDVGLDLFEIHDGRRVRKEVPGPVKGRLSAGVALRPLLQDAVLPTCAYVGGPSEVGYQAELLDAYRAFGIEPPVIFPRITATLIEPKISKLLEKHRLEPAAVFGDEKALAAVFQSSAFDAPSELKRLPEAWLAEVERLTKEVGASGSVAKAKERTAAKVREAVEALAERVEEELRRADATGQGQFAKLMTHLRPQGKLQERVFTPFYYAALFGPDFFKNLAAALDVFAVAHPGVLL